MGVREVLISRESLWQNPLVERLVGSLRRACPDHVIVLGGDHLRRIVSEYIDYYHHDRTHHSLEKDSPFHRPAKPRPEKRTELVALPRVGGLHHRYEWREAA